MTKLLLAEDDEFSRDMLARRLERIGYEVVAVPDGQEAVAAALRDQPDLILLDLDMPILDGRNAMRLLRSDIQTFRIPIIILTAHTTREDVAAALDAGCFSYEAKPVVLRRLVERIEEALQAFARKKHADSPPALLENDFRRALACQEFEVYYEPKVNLETDQVDGFEALVRWNRPGYGVVPPVLFTPAIERFGLVVPLGKYVLERACMDTAELRRTFPEVFVSVNSSGRQFAEPGLVEQIGECLSRASLEPAALRLEVAEAFLVEDPEKASAALCRIRRMGVGLELDDSGSGYSSLDLQRFPFDSIKIDRSFVAGLTSRHESAEIVRGVTEMARSLNLSAAAEGIEEREQLECLKKLGCRYGQGFWFSPPLRLASLKQFLEEWPARRAAETAGGRNA